MTHSILKDKIDQLRPELGFWDSWIICSFKKWLKSNFLETYKRKFQKMNLKSFMSRFFKFSTCPELWTCREAHFSAYENSIINSTLVEGSVKEKFWIRDSAINSWRSPDSVLNWFEALVVEYWQPKIILVTVANPITVRVTRYEISNENIHRNSDHSKFYLSRLRL